MVAITTDRSAPGAKLSSRDRKRKHVTQDPKPSRRNDGTKELLNTVEFPKALATEDTPSAGRDSERVAAALRKRCRAHNILLVNMYCFD